MANVANLNINFSVVHSTSWTRSGTTITIGNDYGMTTGQYIYVTSIGGDQTTGTKQITVGANATFTGVDSGDTSGSISFIHGRPSTIDVSAHDDTNSTFIDMSLEATNYSAQGKFNIGTTDAICASNFATAFNRDYGVSGLISQNQVEAVADGDEVNITCLSYSTAGGDIDYFETDNTDWYSQLSTDEVLPTATINIDSISYSEAASSPETNIRRTINVSDAVYPVQITAPVSKSCANASELWFDYARNSLGLITVVDNSSFTDSYYYITVQEWYLSKITSSDTYCINLIYGSGYVNLEVIVTNNNTPNLYVTLEYSLNGTDWQTSNYFTGLTTDTYTVYVRDEYGAEDSYEFSVTTVPDDEKPEPYFNITFNQSIQFRKNYTRDHETTFPNMFQDLYSNQIFINREYEPYCQKWINNDTVSVQLQNTYDTVTLTLKDSDDNTIDTYTPTQSIQYIGLKDARDCFIASGGSNKTYIYFTSGDTYDYDTLDQESTFSLNGTLENWMTSDSIQNIQITGSTTMNGLYEVSEYLYDTYLEKTCLVINVAFQGGTGVTESGVAMFKYNSEDWDIYETEIDFSGLNEGQYYIEVEATDTDPRYDDENWISESIYIADTYKELGVNGKVIDDLIYLKWTDEKVRNNADFRSGLENAVRFEGVFYKYNPNGSKEVFEDSESDISTLRATKKRMITLETNKLPPYMIDLLSSALCEHEYVYLNGIQIQTEEYPETTQIDKHGMQTLTIACQVMSTTAYINNEVISDATNYNVLGVGSDDSDGYVLGLE